MKKMSRTIPVLFFLLSILAAGCDDPEPEPEPEPEPFNFDKVVMGQVMLEVNPYDICPLTALAVFGTIEDVSVTITVLGEEPVSKNIDTLKNIHSIPILGLYPAVDNSVVIGLTSRLGEYDADTFIIRTDSVPVFFPDITVKKAATDLMEPGWTLCTMGIGLGYNFGSYPVMFDNHGVVRWYMAFHEVSEGWITPVEPLRNGNLLFGLTDSIFEYDMVGQRISKWILPDYIQSHDVIEKPDGNLLVPVLKRNSGTADDHIVEIDRQSGSVIHTWDLREVLDMDRIDLVEDSWDWLHINSLWYSEEDSCLLISGRNQCILKVTYENELVWILAPHMGWGQAGKNGDGLQTSEYLLTAVDASGNPYPDSIQTGEYDAEDFSWVWGQHAAMYLPGGNLFTFDNGYLRNFSNANRYSRGVEYEIDEENMTIKQVWQYGKERGREFFSSIISDVDFLPETETRLLTSGIIGGTPHYTTIVEVTYPAKEVVFEARLSYKDMLVEGTGWGGFDWTYRAERMTIYP